jgi:hypothetical protein
VIPKITDPSQQIVPVRVQGELAPGSKLIVQALIAVVAKFGKDGLLEINQYEAAEILKGRETVELNFNFERNALQIRVRP